MSNRPKQFVVCISNDGCDDLELRKLYVVVARHENGTDGYLRVIDESGDDYLYPECNFAAVELSEAAARALHTA